MTTQELKNKIERVLGNSIRCLLPSYWWKNLFHSVADRIDEVETTVTENVNDMVVKSLKEFEAKHPDIERSTLYYTTDLSSSHALRNATILQLWVAKITANPEAIGRPLYIAVPFSGESYYVIQHATYRLNAKQGIDIEFLNIPFPDGKNYNVLFSIGNGGAEREPASSSDGGSVMFVTNPIGDLTEEQKQNNSDAFLKVLEAEGAIDINIMVMFFIAKPNMVSVNDNGDLVLVAAGIDGGASKFIFTPEGDVTVETVEPTSSGGVEIRDLRISGSDEDNAYNLQTVELYKESKAIVVTPIGYISSNPERADRMQMPYYVDLYTNTEGVVAKFTFMVDDFRGGKYLINYTIKDDGSIEGSSSYTFDSAMSDESVNAVQNKVIKKYIDDAIANVGGGSSDIVVDTEISSTSTNPVQNKVVYSELQKKQGTISDLADIRSGAALGKTALQSVPSEYVTESELTQKGYATTSQVNDKQDKIDDLEAIRSGAAKGATALQQADITNLVTKNELNNAIASAITTTLNTEV